jgi:D-sedoheptulose 7-phosphate isomerase
MSGAGFLYPFLTAAERDPGALLADLAASARAKTRESAALQRRMLAANATAVVRAGSAMARRFADGGRLVVFGNGGSSTDAATFADLFTKPVTGPPLPAINLAADQAVLTALANDIGFDLVFSRQIGAYCGRNDIAVAFSTSGNSADLMAGLREARSRGLLTIGFAGYGGGGMAESPDVEFCLMVDSQSVHRIQESQALLGYQLWAAATGQRETVDGH